VPAHYLRYLEKNFRKYLKLEGTPVRIELVSDENPFVKGEEDKSYRQIARKRSLQKSREMSSKSGNGKAGNSRPRKKTT
jgi:GTP-binding protein